MTGDLRGIWDSGFGIRAGSRARRIPNPTPGSRRPGADRGPRARSPPSWWKGSCRTAPQSLSRYSAEFSQYRHYRPGTISVRGLELAARTDRIYTKQFRRDDEHGGDDRARYERVDVVPGCRSERTRPAPVSKFRYSVIVWRLSRTFCRRRVTRWACRGRSVSSCPRGTTQTSRPAGHAERCRGAGGWQPAETVRRAAERLNRRGLLLVLSDFYDT